MQAVSGMKFPMACGWTARAGFGIGVMIVVAGGLLIARNMPETWQAVAIFSLVPGALVIFFPTLTGMCRVADHLCKQLTLPALEIPWVAVMPVGGYLTGKRE